jgi:uncharacterized membrane protein YdbT with pleckstrin-like domain
VGFPDDELTSQERVVMHLHPHWKAMIGPFAVLVLAIAVVVVAWVLGLGGIGLLAVAAIALIAVIWFTLIPYVKWRTTHYVITNERLINRVGVFRQHTENIPIDRVSDVQFDQSLIGRMLGYGSLALTTPGEHGPDVLKNLPGIKRVVATLHELIHPDAPLPGGSRDGTTEQLGR